MKCKMICTIQHPKNSPKPRATALSLLQTKQIQVDEPASHLNPVVDAVRVDPDVENAKLKQAAAMRTENCSEIIG